MTPPPSSIAEVRASYAQDLVEGAYLIQVPLIVRSAKSVHVNLSMDKGLLDAINAAAARVGLNRSAFLAQAAQHEIQAASAA